ncbi:esterase-like activity of phytase family protein [Azotobacter chroococcum]|uniref:esterase-like activity of phytase family protein n=1 Tax=Azotobacter chroococcum TaxID=353 RepID=UPI0010AEE04F|nr:esterase-like activity of phytase family protein [Azotobacter chroococcum]TKD37172.1 esterase-like activity of phytase family protein [Azotobacter chroococcum]
MRRWLLGLGLLLSPALYASLPVEPLRLLGEHPLDGMPSGNFSGLARCGDALWAVSDRDDDRLYRLQPGETAWQAEAQTFVVPPLPDSGLPWGLRARTKLMGTLRGGEMDLEGLSCDARGNRYLVSEAHAAVLQLPEIGQPQWLALPPALLRQARASGMLLKFNAMFEGIAVDPAGERLWLAAERERRGLLVAHRVQSVWQCSGSCVLLSEDGPALPPAQLKTSRSWAKSFADLAFHGDKLFSLERLAHQICRHSPSTGEVERCWSFADALLTDARRYAQPWGSAEALWIDAEGAWIGTDNGTLPRGDGETRPMLWHFAAPAEGWNGAP